VTGRHAALSSKNSNPLSSAEHGENREKYMARARPGLTGLYPAKIGGRYKDLRPVYSEF